MGAVSQPCNALSFDIEDWFHLLGLAEFDAPSQWPAMPSLVERYTDRILEVVAAHDVRATFFVVGWIAERYPHLVQRIAANGHELASHSHWHRPVTALSRAEFREDVKQSIDTIEQCAGVKVLGFRAPGFSITPDCRWALDELRDLGLSYDASALPPVWRARGERCPARAHYQHGMDGDGRLLELPISTTGVGRWQTRFCGGGYLRLFPRWLVERAMARHNRKGLPCVVYLHPRDLAPDCPRAPMPWHRRFRCYVGLSRTAEKLDRLLARFSFTRCDALLGLRDSNGHDSDGDDGMVGPVDGYRSGRDHSPDTGRPANGAEREPGSPTRPAAAAVAVSSPDEARVGEPWAAPAGDEGSDGGCCVASPPQAASVEARAGDVVPAPIFKPHRCRVVTRAADPPACHTVPLRGFELAGLTEQGCVQHILDTRAAKQGGWCVTVNLDILRQGERHGPARRLIEAASLRVCDGTTLLWASRVQGTPLPERVCGSDLVFSLSAGAAARGQSVFLLGGAGDTAQRAAETLQTLYPGLEVAGTYAPPFGFDSSHAELARIVEAIDRADPDIVYVALGFPLSERVIARLRQRHPHRWWLGVGISFSFVCGEVKRAPRWVQRLGLEWAHRLSQEPRRLAKRYLYHGLPFAARVLGAAMRNRLARHRPQSPVSTEPAAIEPGVTMAGE